MPCEEPLYQRFLACGWSFRCSPYGGDASLAMPAVVVIVVNINRLWRSGTCNRTGSGTSKKCSPERCGDGVIVRRLCLVRLCLIACRHTGVLITSSALLL